MNSTSSESPSRMQRILALARVRVLSGANLYVVLSLSYAGVLGGFYLVSGRLLQFFPAVFFLAALPLTFVLGDARSIVKAWTPLLGVLLSYEALAGALGPTGSSGGVASLYWAERLVVGFNLPGWLQSAVGSAVVTDCSVLLYSLHMPLVAVASVVLWHWRRRLYGQYATAITISTYSALVVFVLFPTSPPWNDGTAANLIQSSGTSFLTAPLATLTSLIESDKFAAFPSLHTAYAVIFCYFIMRLRKKLSFAALPLAAGILFSTLYLGQHYSIDLIAGAGLAIVSCLIAERHSLFPFGDSDGRNRVSQPAQTPGTVRRDAQSLAQPAS